MHQRDDRANKPKLDIPENNYICAKPRQNQVSQYSGELGIHRDVSIDDEIDESQLSVHPVDGDISGDSFEVYFRGMDKPKLLTRDEERALADRIKSGDIEARNELVAANTGLVASIVKRYVGLGLDLHDLMQEGSIGAMEAANRFDPSLGFKFSTYATHWIRQAATRAISNKANAIRKPVHFDERIRKIRRAQNELSQGLGRQPSIEEVAEAVELEVDKVRDAINHDPIVTSLDTPVNLDDSDTMMVDYMEDQTALKYVEDIDTSIIHDQIMEAIGSLSYREQQVLMMRFGMHPDKEPRRHTLEEVANEFCVTRERIRQIEVKSLAKLRKNKSMAKLISYLRH